jgi:FtsP/CotA-like multicopper oxidase with cupredoxin domain
MKRRQFLQIGAVGAAASVALPIQRAHATSTGTHFSLTIAAANAEMIDGLTVYTLAYFLNLVDPQPLLRVKEGQTITIQVTNAHSAPHGFAIPGIPTATIALIDPGATATISFIAPVGGSYIYVDPHMAPLNRVLGLHGAFIVEPIDGTTPLGSPTPFSRAAQTVQVSALFDALGGGHPRFPGEKWNPNDPAREKLWLFTQIDPQLNARVAAGQSIDPSTVIGNFLPRYFTINGLSGFDTAVHGSSGSDESHPAHRIMPSGRQGQPCLIRTMNAGLATHAVHIHGNHCMELSESDESGANFCETHCYERDVWLLKPLERIDVLLPFERPPDIPIGKWPPTEEPFPLRYVMHCHCEMSQTAGGGNYPQGAVTHWEMTGAL